MSQGIYKITNLINNKCYIGKSSNIEERFKYHKQRYAEAKEWNKLLYKAIRKYKIENFSFEIIEIIEDYTEQKGNEREKYWIAYYNSYCKNEGYNETLGGDGGITVKDPRATYGKITNDEVIYLRKRYLECKYPSSLIYEKEFKNKISKRGFQAIWLGQNAKTIMPEVFTEENKKKQIQLSREYEGVLRRKISLEEKIKCKKRIEEGEAIKLIWQDYKNIYSYGGFRDMLSANSLDERLNFNDEFTSI
jgi:group I intron endonuclease